MAIRPQAGARDPPGTPQVDITAGRVWGAKLTTSVRICGFGDTTDHGMITDDVVPAAVSDQTRHDPAGMPQVIGGSSMRQCQSGETMGQAVTTLPDGRRDITDAAPALGKRQCDTLAIEEKTPWQSVGARRTFMRVR